MRALLLILICSLSLACSNPYKELANTDQDYQIIPQPISLEIQTGKFLVDGGTTISADETLKTEGEFLASMLTVASGSAITFNAGSSSGDIHLSIDNTIENDEGYVLNVNYDAIEISGKTAKGVFYGIQTLRQLLPIQAETNSIEELTLPAVSIKDNPRFKYRGMHLDVARHYFPVDFVKQYIDLLAMHKMNRFHWHLTEDQGWRIEIKKYPKLTEVGAWRNGTIVGHHPGTANDETKHGGFYTQEDVKDIVAYAAERHITVIPEIELPGHSSAAIAAYPSLSCFPEEPTVVTKDMGSAKGKEIQANGTPKVVQETWGVFDDVYCAGKEETFKFLEDVLDEVLPLFPSKYIHIGGDECPKANWKRCTHCQKRIKQEGLKDEHELQSYFITRIEKYLNSKGKDMIGWDEILEGGLAPNATVMYWRAWTGSEGIIGAAKDNHDIIMTPSSHLYFDHYQVGEDGQGDEPLAIGGNTNVERVYNLKVIPDGVSAELEHRFIGVQANLWTEYIKTEAYAQYMILPRMTALSEVTWSQKEDRNWEDFNTRLQHFAKRYDAMGLNYAKHSIKVNK